MPTYTDGETSGPSHMRHFTIMCAVGSVERVGAGGTKKEAKRQAAGAVLDDITSPAVKKNEIKQQEYKDQQDHEETIVRVNEQGQVEVEGDRKHQSIQDGGIIDISNELNSYENKEETKPVITTDKFDDEGLNQKLEELNTEVVEDHTNANTPEESDE